MWVLRKCRRCCCLFAPDWGTTANGTSGGSCHGSEPHCIDVKKPFLDYVLFLDTPGNEALLAASNVQRGWRICKHCQTLFFARSKGLGGICPGVKGAYGGSNGPHVAKQFPKLAVMHDPDPLIKFFYFWRWCFHCEQLFDVGGSKSGVCPKGGIIHNGELSGYYQVPTGNVASLGY